MQNSSHKFRVDGIDTKHIGLYSGVDKNAAWIAKNLDFYPVEFDCLEGFNDFFSAVLLIFRKKSRIKFNTVFLHLFSAT